MRVFLKIGFSEKSWDKNGVDTEDFWAQIGQKILERNFGNWCLTLPLSIGLSC